MPYDTIGSRRSQTDFDNADKFSYIDAMRKAGRSEEQIEAALERMSAYRPTVHAIVDGREIMIDVSKFNAAAVRKTFDRLLKRPSMPRAKSARPSSEECRCPHCGLRPSDEPQSKFSI